MSLDYLIKSLALLIVLLPGLAVAETSKLTVHVINAVPEQGIIEVSLFNSPESFLKETLVQQSGPSNASGDFIATFSRLEHGEYAVVVVHDENSNETYDAGFLGFGAEGLGYSNNIRPWFGRPDFDQVKITLDSESAEIEIDLENL